MSGGLVTEAGQEGSRGADDWDVGADHMALPTHPEHCAFRAHTPDAAVLTNSRSLHVFLTRGSVIRPTVKYTLK
jgi:hypothetical protein